jgi:hypothetical protein
MFHLPDLPNAGYSSPKQKALSDSIMNFIRQIERDRLRLLTIVSEGRERWRTVAYAIWRGLPVDRDMVDAVYTYLALMAVQPKDQPALLAVVKNSPKFQEALSALMPDIEAQREQMYLLEKWGPNRMPLVS